MTCTCRPLKFIQDVPTRWNSEHAMLARLLKLWAPISVELSESDSVENLSAQEWKLMNAIVRVLQPLEQATAELSADHYPTLSQVIPLLHCTRVMLEDHVSDEAAPFAFSLLRSLSTRFPDIKMAKVPALAMLIDPRFKSICYTTEAEKKWARALLVSTVEKLLPSQQKQDQGCSVVPESAMGAASTVWTIFSTLSSTACQETDNGHTAKQVCDYLSAPLLPRAENPLDWWKGRGSQSYPALAKVAQSCFLLEMKEDSIEGIYDTLKQCALISKSAGGIGVNVHCIRASGTYIAGTNGTSNGLVPMLRVYNNTARYVDQGGNKRPGAFAMYLEPWHADIFDFLELKKNTGKEESRARDLFYALWIPDLFMKRVEEDGVWSLMCPHECPGLHEVYGDKFDELYTQYEADKRYRRQVRAQHLWSAILESQIETGTPYMLYKDACNRKSNQKNLGTIKCSNLCTEVVEYTSPDEVAVCNLASIALNRFVKDGSFDFQKLREVSQVITRNLNRIIDVNFYPIPEAKRSNMRHRPIGIGVQGLADCFILLRLPFDSEPAMLLNRQIFETIYYGALEASCELAQRDGPYETYKGSPVSEGILQYDMWGVTPTDLWDWAALKEKIAKHGVRNSLLLAPMPTASTAQILGNNESIEAYTSNIYTRRVLSGEFQVVNHHLLKDLTDRGLWNETLKNDLIANNGSVQNLDIPDDLKALYRTVWEIPQKNVLRMAADRGAYIDQSQSLNVHIAQPNYAKLTSMHFYGWKLGLKTGMYYLRTKPAANAIQFTVDKSALKKKQLDGIACSLKNKDECLMCSA
ncbi:hypothetical protein HPB48_018373 [Haemaphysalis longicornis]|uniref:Ribonucleotide reductase large subunit domain-containing protein n=1 Tax=Haemaphysalis longicornis TaxID=44386 RepID=A0A9J6GFS8_HAELO|nr:hypothetical protein HPB48_018373 [Haemaphysalis longicornis]